MQIKYKSFVFVFGTIVVFSILISILVFLKVIPKNPKEKVKLEYINECIDNRICKEISDEFYIGNNDKELQNGYYDIKVFNTQNGINFVINKLWYKEYNEKLYDEGYVKALCKYISNSIAKKINIQINEDELYKNILDGYIKAKENQEANNERIMGSIKFIFYTENYELVLKVESI